MHQWNIDHGAKMIDVGLYQRPWYYPENNETLSESYIREATLVLLGPMFWAIIEPKLVNFSALLIIIYTSEKAPYRT